VTGGQESAYKASVELLREITDYENLNVNGKKE
jgi:hypothetical protein